MNETICNCGQPTREGRTFCETCADDLTQALAEIPWLDDELGTTITKRKGVDYRRNGGGKGGRREQPSPPEWGAVEARDHLKAILVLWVRLCEDDQVRHQSPHDGLPEDNLRAISRWLMWRIDGLALHAAGGEAVDEITSAVAHCRRLIDTPTPRQYLGDCLVCSGGRLYARHGGAWAKCNACETRVEADPLRDRLLAQLDDRLCTAAEIADLTVYLGLRHGREQVRNRVNQWHKRERIHAEAAFSDAPVFRFGIVWRLLVADEERAS